MLRGAATCTLGSRGFTGKVVQTLSTAELFLAPALKRPKLGTSSLLNKV